LSLWVALISQFLNKFTRWIAVDSQHPNRAGQLAVMR
jgi:hypothetical protein